MPSPRAHSATMRFATDPTSVRLPARVDAIASTSHAARGAANVGITLLKSSTAGTFDTRFESRSAAVDRTSGRSRARRRARRKASSASPVASTAPITMKSPQKSTSRPKSISP